jgi:hypothetical protein
MNILTRSATELGRCEHEKGRCCPRVTAVAQIEAASKRKRSSGRCTAPGSCRRRRRTAASLATNRARPPLPREDEEEEAHVHRAEPRWAESDGGVSRGQETASATLARRAVGAPCSSPAAAVPCLALAATCSCLDFARPRKGRSLRSSGRGAARQGAGGGGRRGEGRSLRRPAA